MITPIIVGANIEDCYISAGLVNLEKRQIVDNSLRRKRVNPAGSKEEILAAWTQTIKEVFEHASSEQKIGLGIPGRMDYQTGIFYGTNKQRYSALVNENIKESLAARLNIQAEDIRPLSDAVSFFQGEVFGGAARGYKKSLGLTLGIGLGSARYINGRVEDGQLWQMPFKDGVAEDYLSVRWLVNRFKTLSGIEVSDLVELKRFAPDPRVQQVFDEFAQNLSDFLVEVIKKESPEIVLIGGHMESSNRFFYGTATKGVAEKGIRTPIMRAILGEKASVIGAASSWYNQNALHVK